jgi:hypothetical protein
MLHANLLRNMIDLLPIRAALQDADDGMGGDSDARWWRRMRLVLLGHMDRLDTLLALHKGWVVHQPYV